MCQYLAFILVVRSIRCSARFNEIKIFYVATKTDWYTRVLLVDYASLYQLFIQFTVLIVRGFVSSSCQVRLYLCAIVYMRIWK